MNPIYDVVLLFSPLIAFILGMIWYINTVEKEENEK